MDTVFLALRVLLSLGAVLALVWLLHKRVSKGQRAKRAPERMSLVARQSLGRRTSAVLVEVDGTTLLLGVSDTAVTVLHTEADAAEPVVRLDALAQDDAGQDDAGQDDAGPSDAESEPARAPESYVDVAARVAAEQGSEASASAEAAASAPAAASVRAGAGSATGLARTASNAGLLGGSILSPTTWRRTFNALRQVR